MIHDRRAVALAVVLLKNSDEISPTFCYNFATIYRYSEGKIEQSYFWLRVTDCDESKIAHSPAANVVPPAAIWSLHSDEAKADLPFTVGKHKLSQLEITQYDALFVARLDHFAHLAEESASFRLSQSLPDADMRMQIALQEGRKIGLVDHKAFESVKQLTCDGAKNRYVWLLPWITLCR